MSPAGVGILTGDFDGTLATRPGSWTGALCEVVTRHRPDLAITADDLRPHLQQGFPWHPPDVVRPPGSPDAWWDALCIGAEKPHPRALQAVFDEHPRAREGWMIGDSWTADVLGARGVGMKAILVRRQHAGATLQCETLHEVEAIVSA